MMSRFVLVSLFALALGSAPALAMDARIADGWAVGPERAERIEALVADTALTDADLAEAMGSADWRVRQQAAVIHGWRTFPELYAEFSVREAAPTRTGMLRFRGSELADARLAPLFLERLLQEPGVAYEEALIDVLPRTGGDWAEAFVAMMRTEPDERYRAVLAASMKDAARKPALEGIRLGLADASAQVRGEAARAAGWSEHGDQLIAELIAALADSDAYVRANAARSLGTHRATQAFAALAPLLADADAEVRLRALRSMARIDGDALAARPELSDLAQDPDERVARAAQSLR
jgi:HEAT repeat protein